MSHTPPLRVYTGVKAWDTIWKWTWFTRDLWQDRFRKQYNDYRLALSTFLKKLNVRTLLHVLCTGMS